MGAVVIAVSSLPCYGTVITIVKLRRPLLQSSYAGKCATVRLYYGGIAGTFFGVYCKLLSGTRGSVLSALAFQS